MDLDLLIRKIRWTTLVAQHANCTVYAFKLHLQGLNKWKSLIFFFFYRNKHFPIHKNLMDSPSIVDIFLSVY